MNLKLTIDMEKEKAVEQKEIEAIFGQPKKVLFATKDKRSLVHNVLRIKKKKNRKKTFKQIAEKNAKMTDVYRSNKSDSSVSPLVQKTKTIKKKKEHKKESEMVIEIELPKQIIVDIEEYRDNQSLTNCDMILLILEICTNPRMYGLTGSNSTKVFWEKVCSSPRLKSFFKAFQPETLRKYWRIIKEIDKDKIINLIETRKDSYNSEGTKLLPVLNIIASRIDPAKVKNIKNDDNLLKNKTTRSPKDKNMASSPVLGRLKQSEKTVHKFERKQDFLKNHPINETSIVQDLTDRDISHVNSLDDIISTLNQHFTHLSVEYLEEILHSVSFNIEDAFLFLSDSEYFKSISFDENEDYTLLYMKENDSNLLKDKPNSLIISREAFLSSKAI